jgi:Tol biopolymer transport system component
VNGLDDCETPTWSPTGTKLAFVSELIFGQSYAIFTMNVDGSNVTKINLGRQMDLLPAWSRK